MNRVYYEDLGNTSEGVVGLHMGYTKMTKIAKKNLMTPVGWNGKRDTRKKHLGRS